MKKANKKINNDTIAAISTPVGAGGISVIRISGTDAKTVALQVLDADKLDAGKFKVCSLKNCDVSDKVVALYFKSPNSYTGEDVVEIQCHGNNVIAQNIIQKLIQNGCRSAAGGEFTMRAFLNGKIDLTKAEAVFDIINAKSVSQVNSANSQMQGKLFLKIDELQNLLLEIIAGISVAIDYPDDVDEITEKTKLLINLGKIVNGLKSLKDSYNEGRQKRDGIAVAIIGKPNVGKSMLLNSLLGYNRAIVSHEEGTTRDTIEENYVYKGMLFKFIDTAGIRKTGSDAEKQGIEKSLELIKDADIVLAVSDNDKDFDSDVVKDCDKPIIYVKNKSDLCRGEQSEPADPNEYLLVSALKGTNIESLKEIIYSKTAGKISTDGTTINNLRHYSAVIEALNCLNRVSGKIHSLDLDCILADLNESLRHLGSITGITASEEVIKEIFAKFCVGK